MDIPQQSVACRQISYIVPRFSPEPLVLWPVPHCFWGILVLQTNPFAARLFSRLVTQFVPAALVTGVGILLLSNLAKTPDTTPVAAPVETAINAEAVFKITPREPEETPAVKNVAPRTTAAPKQAAVNTVLPPRKPVSERQVASVPAPLPIVQIPEPPQAATILPTDDNSVMGK